MEQRDKVPFVLWCRTFCGWLNRSWLCLHGFAIWQQKGKNRAGERFVLEIRTSSVTAYSRIEPTKSLWQSKVCLLLIWTLMWDSQGHSQARRNLWKMICRVFLCAPWLAGWQAAQALRAFMRRCVWLLSIKGKLASMTCWMVCFNGRGQLQRLVVLFFQLWQVASTPGVSTEG